MVSRAQGLVVQAQNGDSHAQPCNTLKTLFFYDFQPPGGLDQESNRCRSGIGGPNFSRVLFQNDRQIAYLAL